MRKFSNLELRALKQYLAAETTTVDCPNCDAAYASARTVAHEINLKIVQCRQCDFMYTSPRFVSPVMNDKATADDNDAPIVLPPKHREALLDVRKADRYANYVDEVARLKEAQPGGRLLDIGTNLGFFLKIAQDEGTWSCEGVDPNRKRARLASEHFGLKVHPGYLADAHFPDETFDVVVMIDVFEHVPYPVAHLQDCHRILKPGGLLYIKVPNGSYTRFKHRLVDDLRLASVLKSEPNTWDSHQHLNHFTAATLKSMLQSTGFNVTQFFVPIPCTVQGQHLKNALRNLSFWIGRATQSIAHAPGVFSPDLCAISAKVPASS